MKKLFSLFILFSLLGTVISPVFALSLAPSTPPVETKSPITYPTWDDFVRLKSLIDSNFSPASTGGYWYNCIANNTLCPNYRYTSVIEKAIKFIVLKTYADNQDFYTKFLTSNSYNSYYIDDVSGNQKSWDIKTFLSRVPKGAAMSDWKNFWFDSSVWGQLLDASFWVDFSENSSSNDMLAVIKQKITDLKRIKCQRENNNSYTICSWSSEISNTYLPTPEELYAESIYLNGSQVRIESVKDEFSYEIIQKNGVTDTSITAYPRASQTDSAIGANSLLGDNDPFLETRKEFQSNINTLRATPNQDNVDALTTYVRMWNMKIANNTSPDQYSIRSQLQSMTNALATEVSYYRDQINPITYIYTLNYKKNTYTLDEAKAEIEKKQPIDTTTIFTSGNWSWKLPCQSSSNYLDRSECVAAFSNMKDISTAIWAYYSDKEQYPDTLDQLNINYVPKQEILVSFKKNFTYKKIPRSGNLTYDDFEISYIGHIGENTVSGNTSDKTDYTALLSGATVSDIPEIFAHVPADSMVLYVKNPTNLIEILNQKSNTSNRLSGIDASESIKKFMLTFFELKDFEQLQKNLKHEMAIVVNNLDATAPDMIVILSEADKDALSPTTKARVVWSKDGYIFIANSKESLEWLTNLAIEKSMKNAPDFHYVWWKKSKQIQDAFIFVGDAFFEKMLMFETYLSHYRKYLDYKNLWSIQELSWAYGDAFGKTPKSLDELSQLGFSTLTGSALFPYSIQDDGLVVSKNIGSLKWVKTIPEVQYDFSQISRAEIEDYKYNVLKYRDVWRASLDPMGIVLNRYWDGMEIDFFMTPIPSSVGGGSLQEVQKLLEWATKDSLSFVTNPHIRSGILSFILWFDPKKLGEKIQINKELWSWFDSFNKELLNGKNILDYLGGEFAWTLWWVDPDMFEGWNVEKINMYLSVQMTSEEKWKELIDILRNKILAEFGSSGEADLLKWFLAKPLIEDYKWKKIYYAEGLPIPYIGKIGFAYTFIDDFFILWINRSTIKSVIDGITVWDANKKRLAPTDAFEKGTFFATILDGVEMSKQLKWLYEKNTSSVSRYARYLNQTDASGNSLFGTYYITQDRNHRLWKVTEPFSYDIWSLGFRGDSWKLTVRINEQRLTSLSGATVQMWKDIQTAWDFPKDILSKDGIPLEQFLWLKNIEDIISLNVLVQLDSALSGNESLLRNTTFGMSLGDNEVGFKLRIFRNKGWENSATSSEIYIYIMIGIIALVIIPGIALLAKRRKTILETNMNNPVNTQAWSIWIEVQNTEIVSNSGMSPVPTSPIPVGEEIIESNLETPSWTN